MHETSAARVSAAAENVTAPTAVNFSIATDPGGRSHTNDSLDMDEPLRASDRNGNPFDQGRSLPQQMPATAPAQMGAPSLTARVQPAMQQDPWAQYQQENAGSRLPPPMPASFPQQDPFAVCISSSWQTGTPPINCSSFRRC